MLPLIVTPARNRDQAPRTATEPVSSPAAAQL